MPAKADDARVEGHHVFGESLLVVAFGIYGDEERRKVVGIWAALVHRLESSDNVVGQMSGQRINPKNIR